MIKKIFYACMVAGLTPMLTFAQKLQLSGQVINQQINLPIAGATVRSGAGKTALTDEKGNYQLEVSVGDNLYVSFLGMETRTLKVTTRESIKVFLNPKSDVLDEVVVVGYGKVKKRDLSGAVSQVKAADILAGNPAPSINQALQGRMAGVTVNQNDGAPGAGVSITIRGTNSFSTNSQPLYIVDGIPFDMASTPASSANENINQTANALASINPNDIESIEVLKDASATAIYGSRGANGVVLITTKRGENGNEKVELNANFGMATLGRKVKMLGPFDYASYINEQAVNSKNYEGVDYQLLPYPGTWSYPTINGQPVTTSGKYQPSPEDFLNQGLRTDQYGNQTLVQGADWQDEIYQNGFSQEYNLSVSGGSEKGWHMFSGNFLNQGGTIKNSDYQRVALRTNIGRKVRSWLELGANINYTNGLTNFAKSNAYDYGIIRSALIFPVTYGPDMSTIESDQLNWLASNPGVYVNTAKDQLRANNVFSSSYASVKLLPFLTFRQNLGFSYSNNNRNTYYNRNTQEGRTPKNGSAGQSDNWYQSLTSESLLTFDKTFQQVHSLNAVAGFTYEQANYSAKSMTATNFPNDITGEFDMAAGLNPGPLVSSRGRTQLASVLARANYSYKGKYIATASFRRDGSSRLTEGQKFANFLSGALAWRISEEQFVKNLGVLNDLKLRASYGRTGNQGVNAYQTRAYLAVANYPLGGALSSGFAEVDWRGALNKTLKWETTDQYNLGLDMAFLNNRIQFTIDAYYKKTNDLLQNVNIASSNGMRTQWVNSGYVTNKGLELTGKFVAVDRDAFKWNIDANISFNRNAIGGLAADRFAERLWYNADNIFIQRNGMPIGSMFGYIEDGFYDNEAEVRADQTYANASNAVVRSKLGEIKYRDLNGDGQITASDRTIIGNTNPDFVFGLTNNFKYKDFTLGFFWQGSIGNDIFNGNLIDMKMANLGNITQDIYNTRWTEENNENALWPKAVSTYNRTMLTSDRYVENGSYVRLKNVNLGYTFKIPFKGLNSLYLYASATNLLTITDYSWFDPDVNAFGGDASRKGVDIYSYPSSRTFSLGIKADF
ncbi:SusC/RagA family TonB-linked outer membrane protein [Sphingobacterium multivorum]|nr:TonB-dependent receptor [Sphingobacterium multivorum]QRQ63763.1 TonB-dependent receptor [Sphingobacterium multivorum]